MGCAVEDSSVVVGYAVVVVEIGLCRVAQDFVAFEVVICCSYR